MRRCVITFLFPFSGSLFVHFPISLFIPCVLSAGAIALAEVLAESKHLTHLDLKDNDIRVAGLMALQLGHRMNQTLISMGTPKSFRVDQVSDVVRRRTHARTHTHTHTHRIMSPFLCVVQRDRSIIKDLLQHIEQYSSRNQQKKMEKVESERRRLHEAQHAQQGRPDSEDLSTLTAGGINSQDEEDEKEVDPSIVGSLDNVYKDAPGADMKEEDPFKKVPVLSGDHDKPMMEMEKSYDAMVALVEENVSSPLPEDATSLDKNVRQPMPSVEGEVGVSSAAAISLPDLVGVEPLSNISSTSAAPSPGLPLDVAVGAQRSVDLLDEASHAPHSLSGARPVDLTEGLQQPAPTFSSYS